VGDYLGHNSVKVEDPAVMGLSMRCTVCGGCDCHTPHLMQMECKEVKAMNPAVYIHPIPPEPTFGGKPMPITNKSQSPWNDPSPTKAKLDELDLVAIRKAALECSARVARPVEIASDVIRRAEDFAKWIQTGKTS